MSIISAFLSKKTRISGVDLRFSLEKDSVIGYSGLLSVAVIKYSNQKQLGRTKGFISAGSAPVHHRGKPGQELQQERLQPSGLVSAGFRT